MKDEYRAITDREADASIELLKTGNVVPAREFFGCYDIDEVGTAFAGSGDSLKQVTHVELKFLRAVVKYPMRRSSEYPKLAGISPNTLLKIRPVLIQRGFIRENKLETSNRGRAAVLLEPLEPAKQLVGNREE
jgi:hypothetical protein